MNDKVTDIDAGSVGVSGREKGSSEKRSLFGGTGEMDFIGAGDGK